MTTRTWRRARLDAEISSAFALVYTETDGYPECTSECSSRRYLFLQKPACRAFAQRSEDAQTLYCILDPPLHREFACPRSEMKHWG